jgi:hypothetical protein
MAKKEEKIFSNPKLFQEKGYVVVKNAISKETADLITQYTLFDEQLNYTPDTQVPGAHIKYADLLIESLLVQLQPVIEKNIGKSVYPAYSFYRVYRPGDVLSHHKDRPSCELSITICLGYDYKGSDQSWPIYVDNYACVLEPGDLVCYRGADLEHWRDELIAPEGSWHSQAFLHYVDVEGPYADFKYDKRPSLGLPYTTSESYKEKQIKDKSNFSSSEKNISAKKSYITYTK